MVKQYRGCSKLFGATISVDKDGKVTYGTPFNIGPVKSISKTEEDASAEVWADNMLQYDVDGGKSMTRSFEVTQLLPAIEAQLMGMDEVAIGEGGLKGYATPSVAQRPYFAIGYALHDGDPDQPVEYVWAFKGRVSSISKESTTISRGDTASTGRTIEVKFVTPQQAFAKTNRHNLDFTVSTIGDVDTTGYDLTKFFNQVVTPDNAGTVLVATN